VRNSASAGIEPSGCRQLSATASESLPRKDTLLLKSAMPSTILLPSVLVSTEPPAPKPVVGVECPPTLPISERHEGRLDASTGELKTHKRIRPSAKFVSNPDALAACRSSSYQYTHPPSLLTNGVPSAGLYAYIAGVSCLRRRAVSLTAVFLEGDAAQRILTS
jgi:hypothetical protein